MQVYYWKLERQRLAGVTAKSMALEQAVQRGAVDARESGGTRHVARGAGHEPCHVFLLKGREHLILRNVIRVVHVDARHDPRVGEGVLLLVQRDVPACVRSGLLH